MPRALSPVLSGKKKWFNELKEGSRMKVKNNAQMVQEVPRLLGGKKPSWFYESLRGRKLAQKTEGWSWRHRAELVTGWWGENPWILLLKSTLRSFWEHWDQTRCTENSEYTVICNYQSWKESQGGEGKQCYISAWMIRCLSCSLVYVDFQTSFKSTE